MDYFYYYLGLFLSSDVMNSRTELALGHFCHVWAMLDSHCTINMWVIGLLACLVRDLLAFFSDLSKKYPNLNCINRSIYAVDVCVRIRVNRIEQRDLRKLRGLSQNRAKQCGSIERSNRVNWVSFKSTYVCMCVYKSD